MKPEHMTRIVNRKRYDTATATLLAGNDFWDGNNFERSGRNTFLYKTPKGAYFEVNLTQWQGEQDTLLPITKEEAIDLFENHLSEQRVSYKEAFPDVNIQDAQLRMGAGGQPAPTMR